MMNNENTKGQGQSATESLLLVDDEANILSSLKRLFKPHNYRIFTAESGAEGLNILKEEKIDLILSDMRMPEMNGAEFLEKAAKAWPKTVRILLTGFADVESTVAAINKGKIFRYISKPWDDNDIVMAVRQALDISVLEAERDSLLEMIIGKNRELKELNESLEDKVEQRTSELQLALHKIKKSHESLKMGYLTTVKSFSSLIEMREGAVAGYSRHVAGKARKLAVQLGLSDTEIQDVLYASLLHEIGKIGMPDYLFNKPLSELSSEDQATVRNHPIIGEGVMMGWEHLEGVSKIIRSHRECYNGSGYPDHLEKDEISIGARIIGMVSDFEALRLGKVEGKQYSIPDAEAHLIKYRGKKYDPQLVDAFLDKGDTQQATQQKLEHVLPLRSLMPGMVLTRDVMLKGGVLLLSEDHRLDEHNIEKLHDMVTSLDNDQEIYVLV